MLSTIEEGQQYFEARAAMRLKIANVARSQGRSHYAVPCLCHSPKCPDWHVAPLADTHGVSFDRAQAEAVAIALNGMSESAGSAS